jgi:iron(III) transport system ATP-binding protein
MNSASIEVRGLNKAFGPTPVLREISLRVEPGTVLALLGPSGCGKTTLLRTIAGLESPDAGEVLVADRVLACSVPGKPRLDIAPEHRRVGMVFQDWALFPHRSVAGNVGYGLPRGERRSDRVEEALEMVGLGGLGDRSPATLSGGQQQRVALARALAPSPSVVLLDEPFSALDTGLRASLRHQVATALADAGATGVLVTHDQGEALAMADRVAVMRHGRIVQVGPPAEVYRRPLDLWVARFLGDAVVVPGHRVAGRPDVVDGPFGLLPLAPGFVHHDGAQVSLFCRPEQLRPAAAPTDGSTASGATVATVDSVRFHGPDAEVSLRVGPLTVRARWPSTRLPAPGDVVAIEVEGPVLAFPPG